MKLEQIVTSRELSEKLNKYINGESLFWWCEDYFLNTTVTNLQNGKGWLGNWFLKTREDSNYRFIDEQKIFKPNHHFPAYTSTELAELMKDVDDGKLKTAVRVVTVRLSESVPGSEWGFRDIHFLKLFLYPEIVGEILLYLCEHELINLK